MTNLNIVELIESNPITRLSKTYQGKLLSKIKNEFKNEDQQLFVASFYSYLKFNPTTDFVIDLDDVWKWLGFNQKIGAKRLLEKNFVIDKDYTYLLDASAKQSAEEKKHGGCNKETFMLTIKAFTLFCLKAGTSKADQIHEYYIKLEETLHQIVNEESNELRLQFDQLKNEFTQSEQKNKQAIDKLKKDKELEKHNILIREFGHAGSLVYIIKVKSYENGEYIIKIGESRRGVEARLNEHKTNHEEASLLDCFLVKRSKDFETFLHNHSDVKFNVVKDLQGHETERELFLIGKNLSYGVLLNIIKKNINQFNDIDYDIIKEEIQSLKDVLMNTLSKDTFIKQMMDNQALLIDKINNLEKTNKEILEKLNSNQTRVTTGFEEPLVTVGPRLQKINPETMQLVKVYETVSESMREDSRLKRPSLQKAVQENTIYNGFRWLYVDRELDPNIIHSIQETKATKVQSLGYIAKVNPTKTRIENVYLDRKTAALNNNYQSPSALDNPVKNKTLANGHYYILYENCTEELKDDFIERNNGEPLLYKEGVGQFDNQNQLLREFSCKYDCLRSLSMSDKTLAKALDKNIAYNGFYYKSIGSKTSCFI